jgi:DNA-binding CsgD family transcriptional regulator
MKLTHRPQLTAKLLRGHKTGRKKVLNDAQVDYIRAVYDLDASKSQQEIAEELGVHRTTVRQAILYLGAYQK